MTVAEIRVLASLLTKAGYVEAEAVAIIRRSGNVTEEEVREALKK